MGQCIICGTPVDGHICNSHEEDAVFEFEGTSASGLTPNRYYRGTVDGYADFGVFVDVGDHVTGLLHRSELDKRLESLDWEPGDNVYVQVLDVRDNGNVDLGWSIRQDERDFRGTLVETDSEERLPEVDDAKTETSGSDEGAKNEVRTTVTTSDAPAVTEREDGSSTAENDDTAAAESNEETPPTPQTGRNEDERVSGAPAAPESVSDTVEAAEPSTTLNRSTVDALDDQVGQIVRLEGEITGVRQTSGPTVFELRDETATVECAAFEEAGVRAYPDVELDDVVALEGEVERHHGDLQVETEALEILDGEKREAVVDRLESALEKAAEPSVTEPLADHPAVESVEEAITEAATTIRRAVMETRPIVIRHRATADGYVAGAAIEHAALPLIREKHTRDDAVYHYVERRPLDGRVYDMDAATNDATAMLDAAERHGEQLPLVVVIDAGSTRESADGYELLSLYGAETVVIDESRADEAVRDAVSVSVAPSLEAPDESNVTTTALATEVSVRVNDDVRDDLAHLPAVSYWEDVPEKYAELASQAGYDETAIDERREAISLEAYYQSYKDKRELIADLLFDGEAVGEDGAGDLAAHVSEQFRAKLETELDVARENLRSADAGDVRVSILDTAAFTHRFDFPTTTLLLDELHRQERENAPVTLGLAQDELHVRSTDSVNVRELGESIDAAVPEAGVRVVGGPDGHVEFLSGERDSVREAALDALGELFG